MIHEREGRTHTHTHTHRQTPHDGIGRAYALHRAAKTTMAGLPDGEKLLKICLPVLTQSINQSVSLLDEQSTNVTDTQTDRQTPHDG